MANGAFGAANRVLTGVISAGSEVSGLGAGNLQTPHGNDASAWRTSGVLTSAAGAWFYVDAGAAVTWRAFALAATNLTTAATVRWRVGLATTLGAALDPSALAYDSGTISAGVVANFGGQSVHLSGAEVSGRYLRCDLDDAANTDGFLSVALAYAGPIWQPAINYSPETALTPTRAQDAIRSRGGATFLTPRYYERGWQISHDNIAGADIWTQLMPLDRASANGENILFLPDPASADINREAVFGLLETTAAIGFRSPLGNVRSWRARIAERL